MKKDPAFLFYSKDFYEGTRTMMPEERACYVDLLIYQHQNGPIPNDLKRILMYCSGVDIATLKATLEAKFKLIDKGWVNEKLKEVVLERSEFKSKMSVNGTIGQFWKKCKAFLVKKEYDKLRKSLIDIDNIELYDYLKDKEVDKSTLKALLKALLKHYAIEDEDANVDVDKNEKEDEKEKIELPYQTESFENAWNEWKDYKRKDHKFKYTSLKSEQAALAQLSNLANNENDAIEIMNQSIANGWKGIFEIKNKQNGKSKRDNKPEPGDYKAEAEKVERGEFHF